jgi:hypothetical protein
MGRYRVFSKCPAPLCYTEYYEKKDSTTILKFARSIVHTDKKTDNFKMCCERCSPLESSDCYISVFQNYASLIKLLKREAELDKNCNSCADIPLTMLNGLESEICFDEFYETIDNFDENNCKCLNVRSVNNCIEKLGKLYPYGHFNNNCKSPNISLKRKLFLKCHEKKPCPTYVFCKCRPDAASCKCCDYNVVYPHNNKFISYTISGCDTPSLYNYFNNPTNNPSKTPDKYAERLRCDKILQNKILDSFSKYSVTL